jgi:hypothetical protein
MAITRNGKPERLVIDGLMKRHSSVAGRATTCWKAHREGDKSKQILVVKDSWQYPEREEEGELLREATENDSEDELQSGSYDSSAYLRLTATGRQNHSICWMWVRTGRSKL